MKSSVVTQKATESDDAGLELTLEAQKAGRRDPLLFRAQD